MKTFLKSKLLWVAVGVVVIGVAYAQLKPEPQPEYTTAQATKQTLTQTVSVTGAVRGSSEIELNFETTGELAEILVAKGDEVTEGQILARLSSKQINNQINEAQAAVTAAQAELQKLVTGASAQEIAVSQERVSSAQVTLSLRQQDLVDLQQQIVADRVIKKAAITAAERDLLTARDNLIRVMENELFDASTALNRVYDILEDSEKKDTLGVLDSAGIVETKNSYNASLLIKQDAEALVSIAQASKTNASIEAALLGVYDAFTETSRTLSLMYATLVNSLASSDYTQTEINTDRTNISSDQATISASISSVQSAESAWEAGQTALVTANNNLASFEAASKTQLNAAQGAVDAAQSSLNLAQAELDVLLAPARDEDIALQRSRVTQAQAQLSRAQDELDNITLYAPLDGVITNIEFEVGEITSLNGAVMTMLGDTDLEIEIDIPESDIAKVKAGQVSMITLDAFGDDVVFPGHIVFIDPAETVIQDVVYYQITATFDNEAIGAKPGMTANVDITTNEKEDVLVIPARAVKQNGTKYVDVLEQGMAVSKEVTTGLRGDNGLIEITSGLSEGEQVITFIKEE